VLDELLRFFFSETIFQGECISATGLVNFRCAYDLKDRLLTTNVQEFFKIHTISQAEYSSSVSSGFFKRSQVSSLPFEIQTK